MNRTCPVPCIVCGNPLEEVDDTSNNQPHKGTTFMTTGHYGSTAFDPQDGSYLEINVCDPCLQASQKSNRVMWSKAAKPVMHNGVVVGWCKTPNRQLVLWNGNGDFDNDDVLHVDSEDLVNKHLYPEIDWRI